MSASFYFFTEMIKMPGLGTVINCSLIVLGGLAGIFIGKALKERIQNILLFAMGLSVVFIGAAGALSKILVIENGALNTQGTMMMIFSLALGGLIGELIDIEGALERFGRWLREKSGSSGDKGFITAFMNASLTVCIGAMAVIGSINDALYGDIEILITKGILDLVIIMVMASSLGKGCIFSAIPVAIFQGTVTALSKLIEPVMTEAALANLSLVGSILIFCVGLNLCFDKKIKVANLLPSIVFAVAAAFLPWF